MVRNTEDGSDHFLHIKEGVTQGDPLDIIAYGIGVLPLIREIQDSHPCVSQPWYAGEVLGMEPGTILGAEVGSI